MYRWLLLAWLVTHAAVAQVRVWQDSIQLPTYAEGDPDPDPQFAAFTSNQPANYPYPYRSQVRSTPQDRSMVAWRSLNIENEYLSCRILPDLGGHIYSCYDKLSDREIFHKAQVIKKDLIGQRGAWTSTGIEPNFPVTHSRTSASPVAFATRIDADGAGAVIVSDTDRVTGLRWRVEYRLRPGVASLEQRMTFYNPTAVRKPYLWWNNAAIEWDDPGIRYILPTKLVISEGAKEVSTWPVNSSGVDMSVVQNASKELTWFAYRSHEPFLAIYKPKFRTGVAHYADPTVVSGKKLWIMGRDNIDLYRTRLSDGGNVYIEMQAGLFQDQETFEFLGPEQSRAFTEFWIPFRDLSGLSRATPDAALYLARTPAGISIELGAIRKISGAKIRVLAAEKSVAEWTTDLDPKQPWKGSAAAPGPVTVLLLDSAGEILLQHREGDCDADKPEGIKTGPQISIDWNANVTQGLLVKRGDYNEKLNQTPFAQSDYVLGLRQFSNNREFDKAAGRLALSLGKCEEAAAHLKRALSTPILDYETLYYAGIAESSCGNSQQAARLLSQVSAASEFGPPAALERSFLAAREGNTASALQLIQALGADPGRHGRVAALRIALLRHSGNRDAALAEVKSALKFAPEDPLLRFEGTLAGIDDPGLWSYLAGDVERVLDIADEYLRLAFWQDAAACLSRDYDKVDPGFLEPGAVKPRDSALAAYYLAFVQKSSKQDAAAELGRAAALGTRYQFPYRLSSYAVLRATVQQNPKDATAHALLGNLDAYALRLDDAAAQWREAVALNPKLEIERKDLARAMVSINRRAAPASPAPRDVATQKAAPAAAATPAGLPSELAVTALIRAAAGSDPNAGAVFRTAAFAGEKQPLLVRQAYPEVQLQVLLAASAAGKCEAMDDRVENIGQEDTSVPFTLYGFGQFTRAPHFQYYLGVVEENCGLHKLAQKYWTRASKLKEPPASIEFAYPILAAARLNPAARERLLSEAANSLRAEEGVGESPQALSRAILSRPADGGGAALAELSKIARVAADPMTRYLATVALRQKSP